MWFVKVNESHAAEKTSRGRSSSSRWRSWMLRPPFPRLITRQTETDEAEGAAVARTDSGENRERLHR